SESSSRAAPSCSPPRTPLQAATVCTRVVNDERVPVSDWDPHTSVLLPPADGSGLLFGRRQTQKRQDPCKILSVGEFDGKLALALAHDDVDLRLKPITQIPGEFRQLRISFARST